MALNLVCYARNAQSLFYYSIEKKLIKAADEENHIKCHIEIHDYGKKQPEENF